MEKTLITWSVPNIITIWLMLALGFLILALGAQFAGRLLPGNKDVAANNSGGY